MLKKDIELEDTWVGGGLLAVLGLYVIVTAKKWEDVSAGFLLLGFGVVYMASVSKDMRDSLSRARGTRRPLDVNPDAILVPNDALRTQQIDLRWSEALSRCLTIRQDVRRRDETDKIRPRSGGLRNPPSLGAGVTGCLEGGGVNSSDDISFGLGCSCSDLGASYVFLGTSCVFSGDLAGLYHQTGTLRTFILLPARTFASCVYVCKTTSSA